MDEKKICFITCVNDARQYAEARLYLEQLYLPPGTEAEFRAVEGASSMAEGYNAAMRSSEAKYKVYLHQDVCIVNKQVIATCLDVFKKDEQCGLIGTVGCLKLPKNGMWWDTDKTAGASVYTLDYEQIKLVRGNVSDSLADVQAIDGIFMMTQYDIPWREDLFRGWHFYDIAQSLEFARKGYKVQVPSQDEVWCIHDTVEKELTEDYHHWRQIFLREYGKELSGKG